MPAPKPPVKQTPEEKAAIFKRQMEELERLADSNPVEARRQLIGELTESRAIIDELRAKQERSDAEIKELRDEQERAAEVSRRLADNTIRMLDDRNKGGASSGLRHFDSIEDARDVGVMTLLSLQKGPDILQRSAAIQRMYEDAKRRAESRALTGGTGSGDNFVIDPQTTAIIGAVPKFTKVFANCRNWPMATDSFTLRRRGARTRGYRVDAGGSITDSDTGNPSPFSLTAKKYAGLSYIASELWEDANTLPSLADILVEDHADAIAELFEYDVVRGVAGSAHSGLAWNPGNYYFNGFLGGNAGFTPIVMNEPRFEGITFPFLDKLIFGLKEEYSTGDLKFHFARTMLQIFAGKMDKNGNFIWQPATGGQPALLRNYPYETWRTAPGVAESNQASKPFIAFGDMKKAMFVGTRREVRIDQDTSFKFSTDEVAVRSTARYASSPADLNGIVVGVTAAA